MASVWMNMALLLGRRRVQGPCGVASIADKWRFGPVRSTSGETDAAALPGLVNADTLSLSIARTGNHDRHACGKEHLDRRRRHFRHDACHCASPRRHRLRAGRDHTRLDRARRRHCVAGCGAAGTPQRRPARRMRAARLRLFAFHRVRCGGQHHRPGRHAAAQRPGLSCDHRHHAAGIAQRAQAGDGADGCAGPAWHHHHVT